MVVKRAVKTALAVKTRIGENGSSKSGKFVVHLYEKGDGNYSPRAMPSTFSAQTEYENDLKYASAHCILVE